MRESKTHTKVKGPKRWAKKIHATRLGRRCQTTPRQSMTCEPTLMTASRQGGQACAPTKCNSGNLLEHPRPQVPDVIAPGTCNAKRRRLKSQCLTSAATAPMPTAHNDDPRQNMTTSATMAQNSGPRLTAPPTNNGTQRTGNSYARPPYWPHRHPHLPTVTSTPAQEMIAPPTN